MSFTEKNLEYTKELTNLLICYSYQIRCHISKDIRVWIQCVEEMGSES